VVKSIFFSFFLNPQYLCDFNFYIQRTNVSTLQIITIFK
jgi:hypothetical protein